MENWDVILWTLVQFAVVQLVIERSLYVIFETDIWNRAESELETRVGLWFDVKPVISIAFGIWLSLIIRVDLIALVFPSVAASTVGLLITGLYLAAGSKAVFLMFRHLRELRAAKIEAVVNS